MAWVDDRIWCHPKFVGLTAASAWVYVKALAYSGGMNTKGRLTPAQQKLLGSSSRVLTELVAAGLWDLNGFEPKTKQKTIVIHDWDAHNSDQDERRLKDRERKRRWRETRAGKPNDQK